MRFVFDQVYNISDDVESDGGLAREPDFEELSSPSSPDGNDTIAEYTFVNENEDDERIPQLFLPKVVAENSMFVEMKPIMKTAVEETLDPQLQEMLQKLDIKAKLPKYSKGWALGSLPVPAKDKVADERVSQHKENLRQKRVDAEHYVNMVQSLFTKKLTELETSNKAEIAAIKEQKRLKEEELRKRQEEEHKRKLEEEERQRIVAEQERKRKEEEARRKQEREEKERQQKLKAEKEAKEREAEAERFRIEQESKKNAAITNFALIEKLFWSYKEKIKSIKRDIVEPVKILDVNTRKILSTHKRKINPKFGQLTNEFSQLTKIQQELCSLVDETRADQMTYLWILNFIAKAIIHQAEREVGVKPEMSVPLAHLTLYLLAKYAELKDLLMARFVKKCPYVIGYTCSLDTEKGRENMGWKRKSSDKWEEDIVYDERIGGIMALYGVLTRLPLPAEFINNMSHPLPISNSWKLLARMSNTSTQSLTNTHFIALGSWWDAAGAQFLQVYGQQGRKLLNLIGNDLINSVSSRKYVGAARLRILFEDLENNNYIKSFPEMIP